MLRSLRTKLMLSHLGLVLMAMIVLAFYLLRSMNWFYLGTIQVGMRDELALLSRQLGPELATGDRDAIRRYLAEIDPNISVGVLVADANGVIVGTTEQYDASLVGRSGTYLGLSDAVLGHIEEVAEGVDQPTADAVYVVAPIEWQGRKVGSMRLSYQLRDLRHHVERLTDVILLGLAGAAGLGLLVSMILAQSLSDPARGLAAAARALTAGDLSHRVRPKGNDEIREAGRAFDALADRLQKLEWARQQLLGDVAHDLHSAVTGVSMAVEALQRGAVDDWSMRSILLDGLASHSQRIHRLADDLLQAARIEAGRLKLQPALLSTTTLLRTTAAEFTAEGAEQGVCIELEAGADLPRLWADGQRLAQALGNLVENAIRHTPAGGKVAIGGEMRGDNCILFVRDEGPGIAERDLAKLFDRFKRFDTERPGRLGFGLAIAKGLVEAHGGHIEVANGPERGTTFSLVLPIPQSPSEHPTAETAG